MNLVALGAFGTFLTTLAAVYGGVKLNQVLVRKGKAEAKQVDAAVVNEGVKITQSVIMDGVKFTTERLDALETDFREQSEELKVVRKDLRTRDAELRHCRDRNRALMRLIGKLRGTEMSTDELEGLEP